MHFDYSAHNGTSPLLIIKEFLGLMSEGMASESEQMHKPVAQKSLAERIWSSVLSFIDLFKPNKVGMTESRIAEGSTLAGT